MLGAVQVLSRNFRWGGSTDFLELQAVLFFALVVTSFAYGYAGNSHVRIDLLSNRIPARAAAILDMFAAIAVVTPLCGLFIHYGAEFAWRSLLQGETLGGTGLALGWLARAAVPLGFVLLQLAAIARFLRCYRDLREAAGTASG